MHNVNLGTSIAAEVAGANKQNKGQQHTKTYWKKQIEKNYYMEMKNKDDGRKLKSPLLLSELFACSFAVVVPN
jgi:hypothetical protein